MNQFRPTGFQMLPTIVKNLLIINVILFIATFALHKTFNFDLKDTLGLYFFKSDNFKPWQFVTYMFMHGGFSHILFNMFAVWMFGSAIENYWGPKRFLKFYLITGFGAAIIHYLIVYIQIIGLEKYLDPETINVVRTEGARALSEGKNFIEPVLANLNSLYNTPIVGASGALFGILLAFGMMFPNSRIYLMFIPIPIKAKYFVIGYGVIELISGISNSPGDNVAHFAHLGGMLFGFILIKIWKVKRLN